MVGVQAFARLAYPASCDSQRFAAVGGGATSRSAKKREAEDALCPSVMKYYQRKDGFESSVSTQIKLSNKNIFVSRGKKISETLTPRFMCFTRGVPPL